MFAVVLDIPVVVDDINTACKTAKCEKTDHQQLNAMQPEKMPRKKGRDEQEEVFCPVLRAQQFDVILHY